MAMSSFFKAYRRLNIVLLIFAICPFLQSKRTHRFACRNKYLAFVCTTTITYFAFVAYLSYYRIPPLTQSLTSMVRILKLCRIVGNAYALFFVIIFLLVHRHPHANFFNKLYQFDCIYSKLVKPSINYSVINRMFWIEMIVFTIYLCLVFLAEVKFNDNMRDLRQMLFWSCEVIEQIVYALCVFHMKNCACNLNTRFHQINFLLIKISSNESPDETKMSSKMETKSWQLEKMATMLDILFKARDNLQQAFGSALLVIFIYNLFAVALSSYIMINANVYESSQRLIYHLYYITFKFFGFELPLILKDFYFTAYFHQIGNTVMRISDILLRILNGELIILDGFDSKNGCKNPYRTRQHTQAQCKY